MHCECQRASLIRHWDHLLHGDFSALLLMLLCLWHNDLEDSILQLCLDVLWVGLQADYVMISTGTCMSDCAGMTEVCPLEVAARFVVFIASQL